MESNDGKKEVKRCKIIKCFFHFVIHFIKFFRIQFVPPLDVNEEMFRKILFSDLFLCSILKISRL